MEKPVQFENAESGEGGATRGLSPRKKTGTMKEDDIGVPKSNKKTVNALENEWRKQMAVVI